MAFSLFPGPHTQLQRVRHVASQRLFRESTHYKLCQDIATSDPIQCDGAIFGPNFVRIRYLGISVWTLHASRPED